MTPFRAELLRKSIHISSLWMPLTIYLVPQKQTIILFAVLTAAALGIEYIRRHTPHINAVFKSILRAHEQGQTHNHVGATWMLMGALFCSLFPDVYAVTAMAVIAVCDTFASLVGMRWGRHQMFGKSLEGSIAFFLSGLIVVFALGHMFTMPHYLLVAVPALAITTLGELMSARLKLDDNLFVPALMCVTMALFSLL